MNHITLVREQSVAKAAIATTYWWQPPSPWSTNDGCHQLQLQSENPRYSKYMWFTAISKSVIRYKVNMWFEREPRKKFQKSRKKCHRHDRMLRTPDHVAVLSDDENAHLLPHCMISIQPQLSKKDNHLHKLLVRRIGCSRTLVNVSL